MRLDYELLPARFCWCLGLNLSQAPDLMALQQRLYVQLSDNESMPTKHQDSSEQQLGALRKAASGRVVLLCLDGEKRTSGNEHLINLCDILFLLFRHVGQQPRAAICVYR